MILPDACYRLTDIDLSGTLAEFLAARADTSVTTPTPTVSLYTVPKGKLLAIQTLGAWLWPGNGNLVSTIEFFFTFLQRDIHVFSHTINPALAVNVQYQIATPNVQMILPEEIELQVRGTFTSTGTLNTIRTYMTGWLIPRGSVVI